MRSVMLSAALLSLLAASWLGRQPTVVAGQEVNAQLASLEIDIRPEFDRPSVLVILRGELAEDNVLPAEVSLRIPTSAGGPSALASAPSATAGLSNLPYERTDVQVDFTTVTFTTRDRFFQLEFYDGLRTDGADRSYAYVWPGDLAVGQLRAQVQEPARATDFSVQPELDFGGVGAEGLSYREANLGAFDAGEAQTIRVQYRKTDFLTSAEILNLSGVNPEPSGSGSGGGPPSWLLIAVAVTAVAVGAGAFALWQRHPLLARGSSKRLTRAERRRRGKRSSTVSCRQCGNRLRSSDHFCPECGAAQ